MISSTKVNRYLSPNSEILILWFAGITDESLVMWKCIPMPPTAMSIDAPCRNSHINDRSVIQCQQGLPRVKLTGSGKMPVMDMRSNNIIQNYENISQSPNYQNTTSFNQSAPGAACETQTPQSRNGFLSSNSIHPPVVGLPPKSPVYAVVNKANRRKIERQAHPQNSSSSLQPSRREENNEK